jgi:hypothetical protein
MEIYIHFYAHLGPKPLNTYQTVKYFQDDGGKNKTKNGISSIVFLTPYSFEIIRQKSVNARIVTPCINFLIYWGLLVAYCHLISTLIFKKNN